MKKDTPVPTRKDPVCGMRLSQRTAAFELQHAGKTYYFCAAVCRDAFEVNPEKYLSRRRKLPGKTTHNRRD